MSAPVVIYKCAEGHGSPTPLRTVRHFYVENKKLNFFRKLLTMKSTCDKIVSSQTTDHDPDGSCLWAGIKDVSERLEDLKSFEKKF